MPPPIVYVDTSAIRDGKHRELEVAMKRLAVFVEQNMPRVISYGFFLDEDRTQMTVVAVHPDSESVEFHMDTGADEFRTLPTSSTFRGSRSTGRSAMACVSGCTRRHECWEAEPWRYMSSLQDSPAEPNRNDECFVASVEEVAPYGSLSSRIDAGQ